LTALPGLADVFSRLPEDWLAALPDLGAADSRLPEDLLTALPLGEAVSPRFDLLFTELAGARLVLSEDLTSFFSDSFEPALLLELLDLV